MSLINDKTLKPIYHSNSKASEFNLDKVLAKTSETELTEVSGIQKFIVKSINLKKIVDNEEINPEFALKDFNAEFLIRRGQLKSVVRAFDFWSSEDHSHYYFSMEYMKGGTLEALINNLEKPLPFEQFLPMFQDIVEGAHLVYSRAGAYCKDLRPKNIFLDEFGNAYLGDVGITTREETQYGNQREIVKTTFDVVEEQSWRAPELIEDSIKPEKPPRPDFSKTMVFSLGLLTFFCLDRKKFLKIFPRLNLSENELKIYLDSVIRRELIKQKEFQDILKKALEFEISKRLTITQLYTKLGPREKGDSISLAKAGYKNNLSSSALPDKNPKIEPIINFTTEAIKALGQFSFVERSLDKVLRDRKFKTIMEELENRNKREFKLEIKSDKRVNEDLILVIMRRLLYFHKLKELDIDISYNPVTNLGINYISIAIGSFLQLRSLTLKFSGTKITIDGIAGLAKSITRLNSLMGLCISLDCVEELSDEGVDLIVRSINDIKSLNLLTFWVSENRNLSDSSLESLSESIFHLKFLETLSINFSKTRVSGEGVVDFSKIIPNLKHIKKLELDLSQTLLLEPDVEGLIKALIHLEVLQELSISLNKIAPLKEDENPVDSLSKPFALFSNFKNLIVLNMSLRKLNVTEEGIDVLCKSLQKIKSLTTFKFDLRSCKVKPSARERLTKGLSGISISVEI